MWASAMTDVFAFLVSGLAIGSVYGLVALGFVLVFKAAGAINFAHGEFLMVAGYLAFTVVVELGMSLLPAAISVVLGVGLLGAAIYLLAARHLVEASAFTVILMTIGVAQIIHAVLLMVYGPLEKSGVRVFPEGGIDIFGARISWVDVITLAVAILFTAVFLVFFKRTSMGLKMRSVAESLEASLVVGLRPGTYFLAAWVIAGLAAGVAGFLYANRTPVVSLGLAAIGLRAFPAAMLGGISSIEGAVVGGLIIGVLEQMAAGFFGSEWRDVVAFGVMFLILLIRPAGLFGEPETIRV